MIGYVKRSKSGVHELGRAKDLLCSGSEYWELGGAPGIMLWALFPLVMEWAGGCYVSMNVGEDGDSLNFSYTEV